MGSTRVPTLVKNAAFPSLKNLCKLRSDGCRPSDGPLFVSGKMGSIIPAKIAAKITKSQAEKVAYILVVGPKEAETNTIGARWRKSKTTKTITVEEFISSVTTKIAGKSLDLQID